MSVSGLLSVIGVLAITERDQTLVLALRPTRSRSTIAVKDMLSSCLLRIARSLKTSNIPECISFSRLYAGSAPSGFRYYAMEEGPKGLTRVAASCSIIPSLKKQQLHPCRGCHVCRMDCNQTREGVQSICFKEAALSQDQGRPKMTGKLRSQLFQRQCAARLAPPAVTQKTIDAECLQNVTLPLHQCPPETDGKRAQSKSLDSQLYFRSHFEAALNMSRGLPGLCEPLYHGLSC